MRRRAGPAGKVTKGNPCAEGIGVFQRPLCLARIPRRSRNRAATQMARTTSGSRPTSLPTGDDLRSIRPDQRTVTYQISNMVARNPMA